MVAPREEDALNEQVSESCLCGVVGFTIRPPSLYCGHCHCSICRRHHGAGYVTGFGIKCDQPSSDAGEDQLVRYASSGHTTRSFCGRCGSSLFYEPAEHADQLDIVLASMNCPIDRLPQLHVYFDDRADWVFAEDSLPRIGGAPGGSP